MFARQANYYLMLSSGTSLINAPRFETESGEQQAPRVAWLAVAIRTTMQHTLARINKGRVGAGRHKQRNKL